MDPLIRELENIELKRRRQKLLLAKKIAAFIISGTIVPSSLTIFQVFKNFSESYKNHEKSLQKGNSLSIIYICDLESEGIEMNKKYIMRKKINSLVFFIKTRLVDAY